MLKPVDFANARTIVELGAGTGVFTKQLLKRMRNDARLHAFEIHPPFLKQLLRIKDARMKLVPQRAEQLATHVAQADAIISSLPLMAFPTTTVNKIITAVKQSLKPGGVYVQFQYGLKSKTLLKQHFNNVSIDFTPLNIPPAFIYRCRK
jgi:phospholipid N-methyltransferase